MRCLVIRAEEETLQFPIPESEARLGSDPSNELVVPFVGVSRFHARLVPDLVAPRLYDLDSRNGLRVGGKKLREVMLLPGVVVHAGLAQISLEDGDTSDLEIGIELDRPVAQEPRPSPCTSATTDTVAAGSEGRNVLRLLRELEHYGEAGRPRPEASELLERVASVMGARSVSLVRDSPSGREVVLGCGEAPARGALEALPGADPSTAVPTFVELEGGEAAWCAPSGTRPLGALVCLANGARFAIWQRELLGFSLSQLTDTSSGFGREVATSTRKGPRLALPDGMVEGESPAMRSLLGQVAKTVHSRLDVLLLGETGTGKELLARAIHASGPTASGPFVAINCAAIPSELLESELFGVRARVATGVDANPGRILEADGGTLLLDEVGEMPLHLQPKLLRFLQEREIHSLGASRPEKVRIRVVATSNRELLAEVKAARFRSDLYYRLRGLQFHVPPLRERREDIAPLVAAFASRAAREEGKSITGVSRKALALLEAHDWPGNVRELKNEVTRAVLFCPDRSLLGADHFRSVEWAVRRQAPDAPAPEPVSPPPEGDRPGFHGTLALRSRMDALETDLIKEALTRSRGNKTKAATLLGLTRAGLAMKLKRLFGSADPTGKSPSV